MSEGFVKMTRDTAGDELIEASPLAWTLACVIARRARWSSGFNRHGLGPGEAFLGDFEKCGMSQQEYRTAKSLLKKWGFATFRSTNKGTIAKLTDTRLFDVLASASNDQTNEPTNDRTTGSQQAANKPLTTNEDSKTVKTDKKEKTPTDAMASECERIYELYPRKVDRTAALKAIRAALKKIDAETLAGHVKAYAKSQSRPCGPEGWLAPATDDRFIPYPTTWFNKERWKDGPEPKQATPAPAPAEESIVISGKAYTKRNGPEPYHEDYQRWSRWAMRIDGFTS